jgi:hypothetical protein
VGNIDEQTSETLLWELMLQAGPVGKCLRSTKGGSRKHSSEGWCKETLGGKRFE